MEEKLLFQLKTITSLDFIHRSMPAENGLSQNSHIEPHLNSTLKTSKPVPYVDDCVGWGREHSAALRTLTS